MKCVFLLAIFTLLLASPARGICNVPQPRLVCAEYFASKVVVEATLAKVRSVHGKDDPEGVLANVYTLSVNRALRGQIVGAFRVYEANDSGRATFDWKTGQKYLLFLFYSNSEKSWELDGCGNSGPISHAKLILEQIDAIQSQANSGSGVIHGAVNQQDQSLSISGVRIGARGTNGLFTATTDAKGEFEIRVPAGQYTVHAVKAGLSFNTADFSYENPQNLQIKSGGCAQVQLVALQH